MTKEHAVSRGVLDVLLDSDKTSIRISGDPTRSGTFETTPQRYSSRVLCDLHNHALSGVDDIATVFAQEFFAFMKGSGSRTLSIDGSDLERWLAKVVFARLASGQIPHPSGNRFSGYVSYDLIDFLFYGGSLVPSAGLYVVPIPGEFECSPHRVEVSGFFDPNMPKLKAGLINFGGVARFKFSFDRPHPEDESYIGSCWRPDIVDFEIPGARRFRLRLRWQHGFSEKQIRARDTSRGYQRIVAIRR